MTSLQPGLLILHGNRLEMLRDVVFEWLARHPLAPLEEEIFLVQSNGAAEWLKMALASSTGICAATRVELPGRFLWRTYRGMLGRDRVAAQSPLDRDALTWRLMRLVPALLDRPAFAPVAGFLADRGMEGRLQLARRLADLYDQYQVYRTDWLDAWERGESTLDAGRPLPRDQTWQATLWRALVEELDPAERGAIRPHVHRAFMQALGAGASPVETLPRRVVLFGASHVSPQGLEALAGMATRMQVVFAIPNPCRYHWADIIDGREALVAGPQRQPAKDDRDLATVELDAMHRHAHPLLAAWGRQGRDFMRQLDAFDDAAARRRFDIPRVDCFDDGPGGHLLAQAQAMIRDLVPLEEHPRTVIDADDRSIVFHVAHGAHREVEILHDQLLAMLAAGGGTLRPRDVVVMVPDIERFAPSIRAVFGQYRSADARHIPFDIADLKSRGSDPLIVGLEWMLRLPDQRIRLQDVRDLLDIPAVAARIGLAADALPGLFAWLAAAGVRWGLHARHRAAIGLAAAGDQNTWAFGLRRMLLGYASGDAADFAGIAPFGEIGGLESADIGRVIDLVERLDRWWSTASVDATPTDWAARCRSLIDATFAPADERERLTIAALQAALAAWLSACAAAGFDERVPLAVMREGWMAGVDGLDASRRFMTGGVVFCTSMPLRSVPFEVVCLLGMNDGDFPRVQRRSDFDLMALPGRHRPGDRSRRDDDRYLLLEALLAARRTLYVSWSGRNARDDAIQPPSVLIAQLRDYLDAGWRARDERSVLADRTVEHPLQPFGRRYFEAGGPLTFAREWRAAHVVAAIERAAAPPASSDRDDRSLTLQRLTSFLRNPVKDYFRGALDVKIADEPEAVADDEPFELDGLAAYQLRQALLAEPQALVDGDIEDGVRRRAGRIARSGALPMFERGARIADEATAIVAPMIARWDALRVAYPLPREGRAVRFGADALQLDDWIDGIRSDGREDVLVTMTPSMIFTDRRMRVDRLLGSWVAMLATSANGEPLTTILVGCDATLVLAPFDRAEAARLLTELLTAWLEGRTVALPFAAKTALALVEGRSPKDAYEGSYNGPRGEREEFSLRRTFPDFVALAEHGRFADYADRLFAPLVEWARSATIDAHDGVVAANDETFDA